MKIEKAPDNVLIPVTPAQEFFYRMQLLATENMVSYHKWQGGIDLSLLRQATQALVAQHAIFRCGIEQRNEALCHVPQPTDTITVRVEHCDVVTDEIPDFATLTVAQKVDALTYELKAKKVYALDQPPLFDLYLCDFLPNGVYVVLSISHMVFDGAAEPFFFQRLKANYQALERNESISVEVEPIDYLDYAYSLDQMHREQDTLAHNRDWFTRYLANASAVLPPPDCTEDSQISEEILYLLDEERMQCYRASAKQMGLSLNQWFLGALGLLLHRETGKNTPFVALVFNGRVYRELESMMGMLIKPAFLKMSVDTRASTEDYLRGVASNHLQALLHADMSFMDAAQMGRRDSAVREKQLGGYAVAIYSESASLNNVVSNQWVGDVTNLQSGELLCFETPSVLPLVVRYCVSPTHMILQGAFSKALYSSERAREIIEDYVAMCDALAATKASDAVGDVCDARTV